MWQNIHIYIHLSFCFLFNLVGCIDGGTVNCPVGTIIVNQNQTNHPKKYKINWKIQRPVGEVMEFKIVVKNFNANLTTCQNATDRIELRDLSGYFIGRICSNTSKFLSCSNRVEVTFISSRLESRSSLPKLFLKYTSKLTSGNNESKAIFKITVRNTGSDMITN